MSTKSFPAAGQRARLTRRGWLVLVVLPALTLTIWTAWSLLPKWVLMDKRGKTSVWRKGDIMHTDLNGDGRVDEVVVLAGEGRMTHVKRDSDLDGWFDLEYDLGPYGLALNVRTIRERAPRH